MEMEMVRKMVMAREMEMSRVTRLKLENRGERFQSSN
jgi:hypothetical protein